MSRFRPKTSGLADPKVGDRIGRLTLVRLDWLPRRSRPWQGRSAFLCVCECGTEKVVPADQIKRGKTMSCGCVRHGLARRKEYRAWVNMISRCENPKTPGWENYGGRGIAVCRRWRESVEAFYEDIGPRPSPQHSVDRIDNNGNYEPGNCRWATQHEQTRNMRRNRIVTLDGERMILMDAIAKAGVDKRRVFYRLAEGLSFEEAIR